LALPRRSGAYGPAGAPSAPRAAAAAPQPAGGRASGNAPSAGAKPELSVEKSLERADRPATQPPLTKQEIARARLAEPLRDLATKVEKDGQHGNLTVGKLKVAAYRVDVMIYLADTSEKTLEALKKLGFEQTAESKAVKLLVGTFDVRKLEQLAVLDAVLSVKPVVSP
jgi:hypothetical protein